MSINSVMQRGRIRANCNFFSLSMSLDGFSIQAEYMGTYMGHALCTSRYFFSLSMSLDGFSIQAEYMGTYMDMPFAPQAYMSRHHVTTKVMEPMVYRYSSRKLDLLTFQSISYF